jgi:hypothetical protein
MAVVGERIRFSTIYGSQEKVVYELKLGGGIVTEDITVDTSLTATGILTTAILESSGVLLLNSGLRTYDFQVTDDYKYRMRTDGTTLQFELVNNDGVLVQKLYTLSATDGLNTTLSFTADDGASKNIKRTLNAGALTEANQVPCVDDFSSEYFILSDNKIETKAPVPRCFYPYNAPGDEDVTDLIWMTMVDAVPGGSGNLELTLLFEDVVRNTPFGRFTEVNFVNVQFELDVVYSDETEETLEWWTDSPPEGMEITYKLHPTDTTVVPHIILTKAADPPFVSGSNFKLTCFGVSALY